MSINHSVTQGSHTAALDLTVLTFQYPDTDCTTASSTGTDLSGPRAHTPKYRHNIFTLCTLWLDTATGCMACTSLSHNAQQQQSYAGLKAVAHAHTRTHTHTHTHAHCDIRGLATGPHQPADLTCCCTASCMAGNKSPSQEDQLVVWCVPTDACQTSQQPHRSCNMCASYAALQYHQPTWGMLSSGSHNNDGKPRAPRNTAHTPNVGFLTTASSWRQILAAAAPTRAPLRSPVLRQ
jgi:hypothetical protein